MKTFLLSLMTLGFLTAPSYACNVVRVNKVVAVQTVVAAPVVATFVPIVYPQYYVGSAPGAYDQTAAATKVADDKITAMQKEIDNLKAALKKATNPD